MEEPSGENRWRERIAPVVLVATVVAASWKMPWVVVVCSCHLLSTSEVAIAQPAAVQR
jgi:hypothetical protein